MEEQHRQPQRKPCIDPYGFDYGRNLPSLAEEHWRIVDEGDRWVVWFVPANHPERWRELASFSTHGEARDFVKIMCPGIDSSASRKQGDQPAALRCIQIPIRLR